MFLDELDELRGERAALAALARVLADRLDALATVHSAAAAMAAERVAGRLSELIERLAAGAEREGAEEAAKRILRATA